MIEQMLLRVRWVLWLMVVAVTLAGWIPVWTNSVAQQHVHRMQVALMQPQHLSTNILLKWCHYATQPNCSNVLRTGKRKRKLPSFWCKALPMAHL